MNKSTPQKNSLVLYRNRPARVIEIGKKIQIEVDGSETAWVRLKDIDLLHPGPYLNPANSEDLKGDIETAWELLAGRLTTLEELAELAFGVFIPAAAWAAWQVVDDGLFFSGRPDEILGHTLEKVEAEKAARAARAAKKQAWDDFVRRLNDKKLEPEDASFLQEVAELGMGASSTSIVLRDSGRSETRETAHAFLLETGYWDIYINPHPARLDMPQAAPDIHLPDLVAEERIDLTHLIALAIDDDGNMDPDDALSVEGDWLWVHIADAAALIPPGSPADIQAGERAATLYLPEGIIPMLPEKAVRILGLGLAEISPALSFKIKIKPEGNTDDIEIAPSWVKVTRTTYAKAEKSLDEEPYRRLNQLALDRRALRMERGAIDIDLPEVKIRVADHQIDIQPLLPYKSRELVSEAMLMAGEAIARLAIRHQIPFPFSSQPEPAWKAAANGLAGMFEKRRSLQPSNYSTSPGNHNGLGLEVYTQATSPLRRYLDLTAHQQLRALILGKPLLSEQQIIERIGAAYEAGRSIRKAEQLSRRHWTLVYLLQHPQWKGNGVLVEKNNGRVRLLIPELDLETALYLRQELELNSIVPLSLSEVDLPNLEAFFQIDTARTDAG